MTHWQITLPNDQNGDDQPDTIGVRALQSFSHSDYFYLDANKHMVFVAPNKGLTTPNSTNARSELRYMLRGMDMDRLAARRAIISLCKRIRPLRNLRPLAAK